MAQAKKKQVTKTAKKSPAKSTSCKQQKRFCYKKYERGQQSNVIFLVSMSILAATLLFADLLLMGV